jgi:transcriptional regulator with XRE-family HTH domain
MKCGYPFSMAREQTTVGAETINQRIAVLRHTLHLTQKEFSGKIFISGSFQASVELGKKKVNDRLIRLIVTTYGVCEEWLKTGEGEIFEKNVTPDYKISEAVETFKQLSPFFQDFILDQIRKLLNYEKSREQPKGRGHRNGE